MRFSEAIYKKDISKLVCKCYIISINVSPKTSVNISHKCFVRSVDYTYLFTVLNNLASRIELNLTGKWTLGTIEERVIFSVTYLLHSLWKWNSRPKCRHFISMPENEIKVVPIPSYGRGYYRMTCKLTLIWSSKPRLLAWHIYISKECDITLCNAQRRF